MPTRVDFRLPLKSSDAIEALHAQLRAAVPHLTEDRLMAPDIEAATVLVERGVVAPA